MDEDKTEGIHLSTPAVTTEHVEIKQELYEEETPFEILYQDQNPLFFVSDFSIRTDENTTEGVHLSIPAIKTEELEIKHEEDITKEKDAEDAPTVTDPLQVAELDKKMYKCDKCPFEGTSSTFSCHKSKHKDPPPIHRCNECGYETIFKARMTTHQLRHADPSEVELFECDKCPFKTKHKNSIRYHEMMHNASSVPVFKCSKCYFKSKHKRSILKHELKHEETSDKKLKLHYPSKLFHCEKCEFSTKYRDSLKKHQWTHEVPTDVTIFQCDKCTYTTKYKNALVCHQVIHKKLSEVEMLQCSKCSFKTNHKGSLAQHLLRHEPRVTKKQLYVCEKCPYETKSRSYFEKHQLKNHNPSQSHKCDRCNFETNCKKSFLEHQLEHEDGLI